MKDGDGDGVIFDGTPKERPASYGESRLAKLRRRRGENQHGVSMAVTETPEFRQWFGDSKVLDDNGTPQILYHATGEEFKEFRNPYAESGITMFTTDPEYSNLHISGYGRGAQSMPVYVRAERPLDLRSIPSRRSDAREKLRFILEDSVENGTDEQKSAVNQIIPRLQHERDIYSIVNMSFRSKDMKDLLHQAGFDSIVMNDHRQGVDEFTGQMREVEARSWVIFEPNQVKSAIGNNGQFSRESGDISKAVSASAIFTRAMEIKDGDGDGVIFDGTPQQRPVIQTPVHPRERKNAHRLRIDFYHNQPELKDHNEFDWESRPAPEDDAAWAERSDRIFAIHDIATRMFSDDAEGFSSLPPEEQAARKSVLESVWFKCPIRMLLRITHNVGHTVHHPDYDGVTAASMRHRGASQEEIDSALSTDKRVAGMWSYSPSSRENGTLHLGTGYGLPSGDRATKSAKSIYAHELGHVLDGKAEFSKQDDWKLAWEKEIKPGQLTPYATTNPSEGFAEYFENMIENPKDARKSYPQCWQFFSERFGI